MHVLIVVFCHHLSGVHMESHQKLGFVSRVWACHLGLPMLYTPAMGRSVSYAKRPAATVAKAPPRECPATKSLRPAFSAMRLLTTASIPGLSGFVACLFQTDSMPLSKPCQGEGELRRANNWSTNHHRTVLYCAVLCLCLLVFFSRRVYNVVQDYELRGFDLKKKKSNVRFRRRLPDHVCTGEHCSGGGRFSRHRW